MLLLVLRFISNVSKVIRSRNKTLVHQIINLISSKSRSSHVFEFYAIFNQIMMISFNSQNY